MASAGRGRGASSRSLDHSLSTLILTFFCIVSVLPLAYMHASGLAPLVTAPNVVSVVTGTDGGLYWNGFFTDHWGGWQSLSGGSPSPPGLCQSGPGRVELVVGGYDGNIYHKSFISGTWSPAWDKVPTGGTSDQPACAVLGTTMHLVVRGTDDQLWANSLDLNTGTWSTWINLRGSSPSAPALAASQMVNALDLVVRGEDNRVYHTFYTSGSWSTWELEPCSVVFRTISTPAIVSGNSSGTQLVQVAVVGSAFSGPVDIQTSAEPAGRSWVECIRDAGPAGTVRSSDTAPTLVLDPRDQTVYAIWRGADSSVYVSTRGFDLTSTWIYPATSLGGVAANRPAGALIEPVGIEVVVSGATKDLWYTSGGDGAGNWGVWTPMTGATNIDPGLIAVP